MERGATYRGRAMGGTPRPWPKPCKSTRILCAPCTSLEGRTLLPHWIEESFPSPKSCAAQIQRKQGGGRWAREEYRRPCFLLQRAQKCGEQGQYARPPARNLIFTSCPPPLTPSCHMALTPLDQEGQHWCPPYIQVSHVTHSAKDSCLTAW